MPQDELPTRLEWLLDVRRYTCAEDAYVHFRQNSMRDHVLEIADSHEHGRTLLRRAAVQRLTSEDARLIDSALAILFVLGSADEVESVKPLTEHRSSHTRKAAKTCLFEIRRRPAEA